MTIATAYAYVSKDHRHMVGVMADARLSWRDADPADIAVKTHELAPRIAAVSAGTALVGPAAAELTRSLVGTTLARDGRQVSLWGATRLFAHFARVVQRALREARSDHVENEFALAGFYERGSPGVAWIQLSAKEERVSFWRPRREELASVVIGESSVKDLIQAAYQPRAAQLESTGHGGHDSLASAFWYVISSEAENLQGIGGGLAAGHCLDKAFVWPLVEIKGQRFYRGIPVSDDDLPQDPTARWVFRPGVDLNDASRLDQLVEHAKLGNSKRFTSAAQYEASIDELSAPSPFIETAEPRQLDFMSM
jgi:hypothetical protein